MRQGLRRGLTSLESWHSARFSNANLLMPGFALATPEELQDCRTPHALRGVHTGNVGNCSRYSNTESSSCHSNERVRSFAPYFPWLYPRPTCSRGNEWLEITKAAPCLIVAEQSIPHLYCHTNNGSSTSGGMEWQQVDLSPAVNLTPPSMTLTPLFPLSHPVLALMVYNT